MSSLFYGAIDLHSNNNYSAISDKEDRVIHRKRLVNDLDKVDQFFKPYKGKLSDIVLESTYNGYWLMDGLKERGYGVKLAHPAGGKPYSGLKHTDDAHDALWLNRLNRLGILPEGYIYPKELRPIRDLLRKRMFFVRLRTSILNSLKHQFQTWNAANMSASNIKQLDRPGINVAFQDEYLRQSAHAMGASIRCLSEQIKGIEQSVGRVLKKDTLVDRLMMLPGFGEILAWTIRLEIDTLDRFKNVKHYLSYTGLVESKRKSNEKVKGRGNAKNRNKYLRWAYGEAVISALKNKRVRRYHDRLMRKKHKIKVKAIIASKLCRISYMLMKDPTLAYDHDQLFCLKGGKPDKGHILKEDEELNGCRRLQMPQRPAKAVSRRRKKPWARKKNIKAEIVTNFSCEMDPGSKNSGEDISEAGVFFERTYVSNK